MSKLSRCYNCNRKREPAYKVINTLTEETVAFFCSEKCLRQKIPHAKIEDIFPQIKERAERKTP